MVHFVTSLHQCPRSPCGTSRTASTIGFPSTRHGDAYYILCLTHSNGSPVSKLHVASTVQRYATPDQSLSSFAYCTPTSDSETSMLPTAREGNASWISPKAGLYGPAVSGGRERVPTLGEPQRFVAGSTFFNYEAYGSLRPGLHAIELFTKRYVGLAVHVTLCGFAYHFFTNGFGRLLAEYLRANSQQQVSAANYVLVWPQALSLFIGLISDAYPILGYRRKSYMILGWIVTFIAYGIIVVMDSYSNSGQKLFSSSLKETSTGSAQDQDDSSRYPMAYLVVCLIASIGIQISWVSSVVVGIEYAQREQLQHRGLLMSTLVTMCYFGGLLARLLVALVISNNSVNGHVVSTISMGTAALILACASATAIPFVVVFFKEEPFEYLLSIGGATTMTLRQRVHHFWRFCHQNFVYRVLFFIGLHLMLVGLYNQNVRDAVQQWSGVTRKDMLMVEAARMGAQTLSALVWMHYLRNVSWRKQALWGSAFFLALYAFLTMFTVFDVVRSKWFYGAVIAIADIPRAWLVIYAVILATEIAEIGHEGVTSALGMSFQALAGLAGYTFAAIFPTVFGFKVSSDEITLDASETRSDVTKAFFIVLALNLVSFALIQLPPQQKLDAQQMRAFGGYNRFAGVALAFTFVVMLSFNLVANLVVVL